MADFLVGRGGLRRLAASLYYAGSTAARLARQGRTPKRSRATTAGAFVMRKVRGAFGACVLQARHWWACQTVSWSALIAERPTFAGQFPLLARWFAGLQLMLSSPAVALACVLLLAQIVTAPAVAVAMGPIRHLRSYSQIQTLNIATATAGNRQTVDLEQNRAIRYLQVRVDATVDISVANGTGVRNLGHATSLFSEIGVMGGGDGDIVRADPLALDYASEWMLNASSPARTRLASANIGTTTVTSVFRIWFENPQAAVPRETILLQKEPSSRLQFFATLATATTGAAASSPGSGRIVAGAATTVVALSAIAIRVQQINDTGLAELPYFRPRVSQVDFAIAAVGSDVPLIIPIESTEYLRGITLLFIDANEMVAASINAPNFSLVGDLNTYIGGGVKLNMSDYNVGQQYETGSDAVSLWGTRALHYNFQQGGKLSNIYNPGQDTNLRLIFNVAVVPAGFTIRVVKHSLMRDRYVSPEGRRVVTESLPANLLEPVAA